MNDEDVDLLLSHLKYTERIHSEEIIISGQKFVLLKLGVPV